MMRNYVYVIAGLALLAGCKAPERTVVLGIEPELEAAGNLQTVITQNIDPLHQRAGSRSLIAVHGGYWTSHCLECNGRFSLDDLLELLERAPVPRCSCGGVVKPDVVLRRTGVRTEEAIAAVAEADLPLVLGPAGGYPAAWLPEAAECTGGGRPVR
jgi:NAD-dependent deacetylase